MQQAHPKKWLCLPPLSLLHDASHGYLCFRTLTCTRQGVRAGEMLRRDYGWHEPPCGARQTSRVDARPNSTCHPHSKAHSLHGGHFSAKSVPNNSRSNPPRPPSESTPRTTAYTRSHILSRVGPVHAPCIGGKRVYMGPCSKRTPKNGFACLRYRFFMSHHMATFGLAPLDAYGRVFLQGGTPVRLRMAYAALRSPINIRSRRAAMFHLPSSLQVIIYGCRAFLS
jgi:hypothetical protein